MSLLGIALALLVNFQVINSANILGIFPTPSISHQIVFRAICSELAKRGHHVTVMTTDPHPNPPENLTEIDLHDVSYRMWKELFNFAEVGTTLTRPVHIYGFFKERMMKIFDYQMQTPEMQKIIHGEKKYDLVLVEALIQTTFCFGRGMKAPMIGVSSFSGTTANLEAIGNPTHPVYYPDFFRMHYELKTLPQKLGAISDYLYMKYVDYYIEESETAACKKVFGENLPSIRLLEEEMEMLFLNVNPLLAGIRPVVPGIVYMGGLHLNKKNPLPNELKSYLDSAKEGVIYMSLGSNVLSKDLPPERLNVFIDTFKELPYKVLWKFEDEVMTGLPNNVRISKWLPQQDMLGHPNIKAFIFQGGQQSMEEAINVALPLICLPFFGDQHLNAQKIVKFHIGVTFDINTLTKDELKRGIDTVVNDPSYGKSMKKLSELMADQMNSPLEQAVWWAEYVIRHKGAKHLRSPAVGVGFIEYFMLDLLSYLFLAFMLAIFAFYYSIRFLFRVLVTSSKSKIKQN